MMGFSLFSQRKLPPVHELTAHVLEQDNLQHFHFFGTRTCDLWRDKFILH
uniref:Uncharacterized protein n=1 Tax=Utricularia reniformis TaxID=192314 RepID=A0A1Y0B172_9LAMI|nr:hypothetical protein AEK19_MT0969 [Utricularia reniformis]ART31192.1 hypothetical protein AEK19_MT0969 [Utricularia reniformis]